MTDRKTLLGNNLPVIRAVYTRTDLILDIITVVLIISLWGLTVWLHSVSPEMVPRRFDFSGEVIAWGNKNGFYTSVAFITLIGVVSLGMVYIPSRFFNYPFYVDVRNHFIIHQLTVKMAKLVCVIAILGLGCMELMQGYAALGISPLLLSTILHMLWGIGLVIIIAFVVVMFKKRKVIN